MLVLTRKVGERVIIGDGIIVEVLEVQGKRLRLGIVAPESATILRHELLAAPAKTERALEPA